MSGIISTETMQDTGLDRALEYAVIQSWDDLMPNPSSGLIHLEYQIGEDGSLDYLTVWASTLRGYWNLICELWMRPLWSHVRGLRFENDYHSEKFARTLHWVMEHESLLKKTSSKHGLIQIYPPTAEERSEAKRWRTTAFSDQDLLLAR
jgi:hypothetical protein